MAYYKQYHDNVGLSCFHPRLGLYLLSRSYSPNRPRNKEQTLYDRCRGYIFRDLVSNVAVPLVESVAEHGRLFVALILLPTIFYPKSWTIPRFISLIAYVIYICIIYNVYLFHEITQLGQFIFHIFVLTKTIFVIVDDLTEIELKERRLRRQQSL